MRFILMTVDRKLYTVDIQKIGELSITYFKDWHCALGSSNIDISASGEFRLSGCGNQGTTCHQPLCFRGMDLAIPKAIDVQTLTDFKLLVSASNIRVLPEYQADAGYPVAMMSEFHSTSSLTVDWMLHVRCNYQCSYCPDDLHSLIDDYSDIENHKHTFLKLPSADRTRMQLFGGEPTLWKPLPEFLEWCHQQRRIEIRIMTNGTTSVDRLVRLHKYSQLVISMHDEYVTEKIMQRWLDFLSQTPYHNRVVFKMFSDRADYQEFIQAARQFEFVRSSKHRLVNKQNLTWMDQKSS